MNLINIYPLGNLVAEYTQNYHMFLTHMVEKYPVYKQVAWEAPGYKILDNSLIELGDAVDLSRVLKAAELIKADEIILPDVFQQGPETIKTVESSLEELDRIYGGIENCPYKLMAVAQGRDVAEWDACYQSLMRNRYVDVIGVPKVLAKMHPGGRPYVVNHLCDLLKKPHHLLGIWYSFTELWDYKYPEHIRSCDTVLMSYLARHGLNILGTRPDGHTLDLETTTVDMRHLHLPDVEKIGGILHGC